MAVKLAAGEKHAFVLELSDSDLTEEHPDPDMLWTATEEAWSQVVPDCGDLIAVADARHAYAVLGYDPATHIVTVWNPHGKDYKPKASPPNPTNGYTVKKGVFEIPLKDFVRVFKAVTYETSASLTAVANPKRRRGRPPPKLEA